MINNKTVKPDYTTKHVWGQSEKELNRIVNKYDINNPKDTIYVMSMIDKHDIESEKQALDQIENHKDGGCGKDDCWTSMDSSLKDRARIMYEAQIKEWGRYKFSKQTCLKYLIDLYTRKSIKGKTMETQAIRKLSKKTDGLKYRKSTGSEDMDYAVDIVVESNGEDISGIQVKPDSYDDIPDRLKMINQNKNNKYKNDVYYLIYDDGFKNLDYVVNQIRKK